MTVILLLDNFETSIQIGLIYGIGTIGLGFIYKYLKFPDFTTVASILIGSVATIFFTNHFGILIGIVGGVSMCGVLGLVTSLQIVIIGIPRILAGIITWVSFLTLYFKLNNDESQADFDKESEIMRNFIISTDFSYFSLFVLVIICVLLAWAISALFRTKIGLYTFAMLGTDDYIAYRHREETFTISFIIILGNSIIGLAGSLAAIKNSGIDAGSHIDFLVLALGGFVLGNFFIKLMNNSWMRNYMARDNKLSGNVLVKFILLFSKNLAVNDEEPWKIFLTFISYIVSTALITYIFMLVDVYFDNTYPFGYVIKGGLLLAVLTLSRITEKLSIIGKD